MRGSPPNFLYFTFLYENFGGEPPMMNIYIYILYVHTYIHIYIHRKFEEPKALSPRSYSPTDAYIQSWLQATLSLNPNP
jgi:hypothetical protein